MGKKEKKIRLKDVTLTVTPDGRLLIYIRRGMTLEKMTNGFSYTQLELRPDQES